MGGFALECRTAAVRKCQLLILTATTLALNDSSKAATTWITQYIVVVGEPLSNWNLNLENRESFAVEWVVIRL
ncbi:MAG: hypothetical protein RLY14_605 [Planctomycetota bacterium]|jgi:hypothetical protein